MKKLRTILVSFALLTSFSAAVALPHVAHAYDPLSPVCNTAEAKNSPNCDAYNKNKAAGTATNPLVGTNGLLVKITQIVAVVAGFVAVLVILLSGFNYITANGDAQKTQKARNALVGSIIGIVIIALAGTIITFVLKKL